MDETSPALSSHNGTKEPSVRSNRSNRTQSPPTYSPPRISSPNARSPSQLSQPKLISSPVRSTSPTKLSNIFPPTSPSIKSSKKSSLPGSRIVSGVRSPDSHRKSISNKIHASIGSSSERNKLTDSGSTKGSKTKNGADPGAMTTITNSINDIVMSLEPQGQIISDHVEQLSDTINDFAKDMMESQPADINSNVDKITTISKVLANEAQVLRDSIKSLSDDISRTQRDICFCNEDNEMNATEDVNFPYHLFLVEIIINKIHMKCDCFELNFNNLVISARFLGKQPIVLYDHSFGKVYDFSKLNVGKSTLFAMSYDKICSIKDFDIVLSLTNEPPCSDCKTKIAESRIDQTDEFIALRKELCGKWTKEQPSDNIQCSASTPMSKNMYYLTCGGNAEIIGVVEVTIRMSFLGKEITTAFCGSNKQRGNSFLLKEDRGMSMYSCQKVEMDEQGKILLDEDALTDKYPPCPPVGKPPNIAPCPPMSNAQISRPYRPYQTYNNHDTSPKFDEIFTKMNANELKIRVPKSTKVEKAGYDRIQEICSCESTAYNTGEQIQFELPRDAVYPEKTYTSNLSYTINKPREKRDKKIINVTPTDCAVPVDMSKVLHPQKDVFILKIGKKLETKDKKTDLEIELVTPKAITEKPTEISDNAQQYSHSDTEHSVKTKAKKTKKKTKGKKDGKRKKGKKI